VCSQLAGMGFISDVVAQYVLVFKCFIIVLLYRFIYTLSTSQIAKNIIFLNICWQLIKFHLAKLFKMIGFQ